MAAKNAAAVSENSSKPQEIFKPTDEEGFKKIWQAYEKDLSTRGKTSMASMINKIIEQVKINPGDERVIIKLDNEVLQSQFNEDKPAFYEFVKTNFNQPPVRVEYTVAAPTREEEKRYLVSDKDKFERMKEINPEVARLKDILDLDIS